MLAGLVNAGPTLNVPVPDSKDRNTESQGKSFSNVLDSKNSKPEPKQEIAPKVSERASVPETKANTERKSDKDVSTEGPPDPKVMDPRNSALKAQRNQVIRKFMDSFESEFGVPPEEMVEAMSQLTAQDLEKPPESTVDNLLAELDLAPQDELKAKKMYLGLLMQLKQIDVRSDMPRPQEDLLSQLSAQRIQLSGEKKEVLQKQVQNLNDKFWVKNEAAPITAEQAQAQEFLKKMITSEGLDLDVESLKDPKLMEATQNLLKQMENPQVKPEEAPMSSPKEISFLPAAPVMKAMEQQAVKSDEQPQLPNFFEQSAVVTEFKPTVERPESPKVEIEEDVETLLSGDLNSIQPAKLESILSGLPVQERPIVDMSPTDKIENVQQIVNQSQVLLKKGGGEVKVEMTPEGMGTIHLKMQVDNGKVQLHMNTETPEAKKLIESSMHDLKHSLAAHQLSVDLVKVDVVTQTQSAQNAHNEMQNQMQNFLNQQQRDGTKQFWQQFNENFGNRQARENYFDAQSMRSPTRRQSLPGFDGVTSAGRVRSDGRGKSLNVVA